MHLRLPFLASCLLVELIIRPVFGILGRNLLGGVIDFPVHGLQFRGVSGEHAVELLRFGIRRGRLEFLRRCGDLLPQCLAPGEHVVRYRLEVLRGLLNGAKHAIDVFRTGNHRATRRGKGGALALIETVTGVIQRVRTRCKLLQLAHCLTDAVLLETPDELVRPRDVHDMGGVAERFHIRLDLLKFLGECIDLLHLVLNHLDILGDVFQMHFLGKGVSDWIGDNLLGSEEWRNDDKGCNGNK